MVENDRSQLRALLLDGAAAVSDRMSRSDVARVNAEGGNSAHSLAFALQMETS